MITPSWEPTTSVRPYEQITKLYLDIETTGLDPLVDRVLMVGIMDEVGTKIIITDSDEGMILDKTMRHLKKKKPRLLIGHNLFEFDLPFLMQRCEIHSVTHPFKQDAEQYQ